MVRCNSSVIRQKDESQNGDNKKTKHTKFSEKRTFLTSWYAHVRVSIRKQELFVFRKIWCALFACYLRFEIHPFALSPTNFCKTIHFWHKAYYDIKRSWNVVLASSIFTLSLIYNLALVIGSGLQLCSCFFIPKETKESLQNSRSWLSTK